ncbi:MAG: SRPBCC domain-containing protein, partial [Alphaproteobacteria bacterium]|nr:SRPBCC domain-containing protein [Alphaproteobacteria bacterium]
MTAINWPEHFKPENCAVHVVNMLKMDAAPHAVWECLIHASAWPEWYPNAANVVVHDAPDGRLFPGAKFRWKTFGVTIDTEVQEFVPNSRIAWSAKAFGLEVYHAWLITPQGEGCVVLTEETQNGFLARLGHTLRPGQMHKFHQIWLENLRDR